MKVLSEIRRTGSESASRTLAVDLLTDGQQQLMRSAVGEGLWEEILGGAPLAGATVGLIWMKMNHHGLLPEQLAWGRLFNY